MRLDRDSALQTTSSTPFGRYRWLRLPFRFNVSAEMFQRKLHQALAGLDGVTCVADDIVVIGCGDTKVSAIRQHDLQPYYKYVNSWDQLNKEKMQLEIPRTCGDRGGSTSGS